jgi:dipeptidyl aminopeptidase/acylaminoacyl peptidase
MKRLSCLLSLLFSAILLLSGAGAQQKKTPSAPKAPAANAATQPPLIDRELLFGNPEIINAKLSPDGKFLAFLKPWKDTRNIWVKGVDEPFSAARLLTAEAKRPIPEFFWTWDSRYIVYVKDNNGDENFNLYAVDPAAKPAAGAPGEGNAPPSRDLTGVKGVQVQISNLPKSDPDVAYIGINDRDKAWHDLYRVKLSTGEKTLVRRNTDRIVGWSFDLQGNLRLALRVDDNGENQVLRVDADKFTKIYSCTVFEDCSPVRFHKDGKRVYFSTNKGTDLVALTLLDPQTGQTTLVESDPLKKVDLGGARFNEATDELALTGYEDDRLRRYFHDKAWEADMKLLQAKFPEKEVRIASDTRDEQLWLITVSADTEPGENYLFDRRSKKLALQYKIRENLPRASLSKMQAIRYPSSDGLEIPAYLTIPNGLAPKNLPLLVFPHGGPWGRDQWGYNSLVQFFANRGYAVLQPNFRASTGYGKKFLDAGNHEWGRKMQDDLSWGVKFLVAKGIADPKHVGIIGGSYGGYATLAGVTFTPDLYAAAVDIVGPSNLITLLDSIPPYWEAGRKLFYERMGDPTTPEGKKMLIDESPLTHAAAIKTPLMVVQGANDPRVNKREADQIVIALRDRGYPVEYIVAPDEGHGFQRPINNLALFMEAERFLAQYLGGRYQQGGSPESVARLKEITVDPKAVTLAKTADAKSVGAPKPAVDLAPGIYNYKGTIALGAQEVPIAETSEIKDGGAAWNATDTIVITGNQIVSSTVIDKGTLLVRKYSQTTPQGSATFEVAGNKLTGNLSMGGQDKPVSMDLNGPVFADGPGALQSIAALPLAEGYTTTYRNVEATRQREELVLLKVVGSEKVTVPAGTFDAYKLQITSADGGQRNQTVWIAKDSRKPVKITAVIAQMGGAVLTEELQ